MIISVPLWWLLITVSPLAAFIVAVIAELLFFRLLELIVRGR